VKPRHRRGKKPTFLILGPENISLVFGERADDNARVYQIGFSRAGPACDDVTLIISAISFAR
jgi:hypothetical protein